MPPATSCRSETCHIVLVSFYFSCGTEGNSSINQSKIMRYHRDSVYSNYQWETIELQEWRGRYRVARCLEFSIIDCIRWPELLFRWTRESTGENSFTAMFCSLFVDLLACHRFLRVSPAVSSAWFLLRWWSDAAPIICRSYGSYFPNNNKSMTDCV